MNEEIVTINPSGSWTDPGNFNTDWYSNPTASDTFTISNASELAGLINLVNSDTDFSGKTIELSQDLDLSAHYWMSIGDNLHNFKGTFDGQNYKISYVCIDVQNVLYSPGMEYVGFFGYLGEGGMIKNLKLSNSLISIDSQSVPIYAGGIVAYNNGKIQNCQYAGEISAKTFDLGSYVGGITGYSAASGKISECTNLAKISVELEYNYDSDSTIVVGGIAGSNSGTIDESFNYGSLMSESVYNNKGYGSYSKTYVGGICGDNSGSIVIDSYSNNYETSAIFYGTTYVGGISGNNSGTITVENYACDGKLTSKSSLSYAYAGGICGKNTGTLSTINCVSSFNTDASVTRGGYSAYIGGIVGYNQDGNITDCRNIGDVYTTPASGYMGNELHLGGIAGFSSGTITNCYNLGNLNASSDVNSFGTVLHLGGIAGDNQGKLINCYNSGKITSTSDSNNLINICTGGIAGYNYNRATISYCYNTGAIETISSSIPATYRQIELRNSYAGGIVGYNCGSTISSYNIASVTSNYVSLNEAISLSGSHNLEAYAGGIAGYNNTGASQVVDCYNVGKVSSNVISSENFDEDGNNSSLPDITFNAYSGGIIGNNYYGTVKNCYNLGDVESTAAFNSQPSNLTVNMYAYSGGICGYCTGDYVSYCYSVGTISSTLTLSNDDSSLKESQTYGGGICGNASGASSLPDTYYLAECVTAGVTNQLGTGLTLDEMKNTSLLGDDADKNLNKDQGSTKWSPDLYNSNNGLPTLSDTPVQVAPQQSETQPPKSVIYITPADNTQNDNYLETIIVKHDGTCDLKVHAMDFEGYTTTYQWYKLESGVFEALDGQTGAELNLSTDVAGTYCVKVTYSKISPIQTNFSRMAILGAEVDPQYVYTSLTITVLTLPETKKLIVFDSNGGSAVDPQIVVSGEYPIEPKTPTKSGYSFAGWYYNGSRWNFTAPVEEDMTLTAHWRTNSSSSNLSLILQSNNPSAQSKTYSVSYGSPLVLESIENLGWEFKDHTFKAWNTKADGSGMTYAAGDRLTMTSNLILYAQWEETTAPPTQQYATISFYDADGLYVQMEVPMGSPLGLSMPKAPENEGYSFSEWNTKEDGTGMEFTAESVVNDDMTVYAIWESSNSSTGHCWLWIILVIIILIVAILAYVHYRKDQQN